MSKTITLESGDGFPPMFHAGDFVRIYGERRATFWESFRIDFREDRCAPWWKFWIGWVPYVKVETVVSVDSTTITVRD